MKRIAIIGAGASGLPAIKTCIENGVLPICLERTEAIGGLWNFRETCEGQSSVMKSTVINTSKEMMSYSDFPVPKEFPNYMHNTKVMEYFQLYAENFNLLKYIRFRTEVVKARPAHNFSETGQWDIEIKDLGTESVSTETYDGIIVCTGHHAEKHLPYFEGEDDFLGRRVHTHDYRDFKGYEDKRVVVIGVGNSGADVAVDLDKVCKQVYLSTRRGSWVSNRVGHFGLPMDYLFIRHCITDLQRCLPRRLVNYFYEEACNYRFDHGLYGLKPKHRFDQQHFTVNDDLPNKIISGGVIVKPNIQRITRTGVEFENGSFEDNIDAIIYATGYRFDFPFIEHKALTVQKNQVNLYKYVFPPAVQPPTIAVIGCIQTPGAIMPIAEMQTRLVVQVFKGEHKLPSEDQMWDDIALKKKLMSQQYVESQRHTIQVDVVEFMDELASLVGCKPKFFDLLKTDPRLAFAVYFGPRTAYQYRLTGPNSWSGARETILSTWQRVIYPFKKDRVHDDSWSSVTVIILVAIFVLVVALLVKWWLG